MLFLDTFSSRAKKAASSLAVSFPDAKRKLKRFKLPGFDRLIELLSIAIFADERRLLAETFPDGLTLQDLAAATIKPKVLAAFEVVRQVSPDSVHSSDGLMVIIDPPWSVFLVGGLEFRWSRGQAKAIGGYIPVGAPVKNEFVPAKQYSNSYDYAVVQLPSDTGNEFVLALRRFLLARTASAFKSYLACVIAGGLIEACTTARQVARLFPSFAQGVNQVRASLPTRYTVGMEAVGSETIEFLARFADDRIKLGLAHEKAFLNSSPLDITVGITSLPDNFSAVCDDEIRRVLDACSFVGNIYKYARLSNKLSALWPEGFIF